MNPSTLLIILLSLVGLAIVAVVLFMARRRAIARLAGSFDCSIYVGGASRRPRWRLGVGVLNIETFDWYPVFGFGNSPLYRYPRSDMNILEREKPSAEEAYSVLPDAVIARCSYGQYTGTAGNVSFALDVEALSALSSWLESAPPGANYSVGRFT